MKPPTVKELRELAHDFRHMCTHEDRTMKLCELALTRWAEQLERKQQHVSHFLRKKQAVRKGQP